MLKKKSDTFKFCKKFQALVVNEKEREIKCLRTDNGDEYTSTKFIEFCSEHSIKGSIRYLVVYGTWYSSTNGVAEHMNVHSWTVQEAC